MKDIYEILKKQMPAREVLEFYGLKGPLGYLRYSFRFLKNFSLDKMAFFVLLKVGEHNFIDGKE